MSTKLEDLTPATQAAATRALAALKASAVPYVVTATPRPEERKEELLPETVDISDIKIIHLSGRTQEEIEAEAATSALENELATLKAECDKLDVEAVRALRAVAAGTATDEDQTYLANNEALVKTKRARIAEIVKQLGSTK